MNHSDSSKNIQVSTPPFRVGGRGSKQLSKAIEKSNIEKEKAGDSPHVEQCWVFYTGSHPCFAKIISCATADENSVIIQPMYPSEVDPSLFVPWNGHLWVATKDKLHPVKMKQEPGGWRVYYNLLLQQVVEKSGINIKNKFCPTKSNPWDLVSLDSDLEEVSSMGSSLFPHLINGNNIAPIQDASSLPLVSENTDSFSNLSTTAPSNNIFSSTIIPPLFILPPSNSPPLPIDTISTANSTTTLNSLVTNNASSSSPLVRTPNKTNKSQSQSNHLPPQKLNIYLPTKKADMSFLKSIQPHRFDCSPSSGMSPKTCTSASQRTRDQDLESGRIAWAKIAFGHSTTTSLSQGSPIISNIAPTAASFDQCTLHEEQYHHNMNSKPTLSQLAVAEVLTTLHEESPFSMSSMSPNTAAAVLTTMQSESSWKREEGEEESPVAPPVHGGEVAGGGDMADASSLNSSSLCAVVGVGDVKLADGVHAPGEGLSPPDKDEDKEVGQGQGQAEDLTDSLGGADNAIASSIDEDTNVSETAMKEVDYEAKHPLSVLDDVIPVEEENSLITAFIHKDSETFQEKLSLLHECALANQGHETILIASKCDDDFSSSLLIASDFQTFSDLSQISQISTNCEGESEVDIKSNFLEDELADRNHAKLFWSNLHMNAQPSSSLQKDTDTAAESPNPTGDIGDDHSRKSSFSQKRKFVSSSPEQEKKQVLQECLHICSKSESNVLVTPLTPLTRESESSAVPLSSSSSVLVHATLMTSKESPISISATISNISDAFESVLTDNDDTRDSSSIDNSKKHTVTFEATNNISLGADDTKFSKSTKNSNRTLSNSSNKTAKRKASKVIDISRTTEHILQRPPRGPSRNIAEFEEGSREKRQRSTTTYSQRDAFFGSWPSRKQSASTGTWKI